MRVGAPVAPRAGPCDLEDVGSDQPTTPPERATQSVASDAEPGNAEVGAAADAFEQTYRVGEQHSVALFLALSRKRGLLPFRRARQHEGTVCVRATLSEHDALWSEFLELDRRLAGQLFEVAHAFLRQHVG